MTDTTSTTRRETAVNPFLPLHEYIPDGEPHVFGDRVYLIGSHDREGGETYCELDYVFYSAPVGDLSDWSSPGVSYRASQDPHYSETRNYLYAPDVVQGNDGRYYLYYCLGGKTPRSGWSGAIGVAVADTPDGSYEFVGHVKDPRGNLLSGYTRFDPAVINDEGTIRLYYGFCLPIENLPTFLRPLMHRLQSHLFSTPLSEIDACGGSLQGPVTVELEDDMVTTRTRPVRIIPTRSKGTSFEGHGFFEGSSIRKIGDTYYFVYSSERAHELCYATSAYPDRDFIYGGTIISNGDIGFDGRTPANPSNPIGNNHGGIERIGDQWYVFYHRHTHGTGYSRQACAEEITILPNGAIPQVRCTSAGLNGGLLAASGEYPAVICSSLANRKMQRGRINRPSGPRITHDHKDRFIGGISNETCIEYRSVAFEGPTAITLTHRGSTHAEVVIAADGVEIGRLTTEPSGTWRQTSTAPIDLSGNHALSLRFASSGTTDLLSISFDDSQENQQ